MVAAGLTRSRNEEATARLKVRFEEFLSRDVATALEHDASLLEFREREVTLLFLDLRGFSSLAERCDTETAYGFLSRCLDAFTASVMRQRGLIIDYYGDGFAAMWNAPAEVAGHAELAVNAAIEINSLLPEINASFEAALKTPVRVGIGIHTGVVQVGNCGGTQRVKYGPRGSAVNLASRVEGANKHFGTSCLITGETRQQLPGACSLRRLCQARLAGLRQPVELYEVLFACDTAAGAHLIDQYEQALSYFESSDYATCIELCGTIIARTQDRPTLWLLSHATRRMQFGTESADPIFQFDVK
jgi:adenylate cyclase